MLSILSILQALSSAYGAVSGTASAAQFVVNYLRKRARDSKASDVLKFLHDLGCVTDGDVRQVVESWDAPASVPPEAREELVGLPDAELPPPIEPPVPEVSAPKKRKGHGRRHKPADLPRRPEVIDLSDAEKVCSCCHATKIRIGQIVSERLDYQPMALFVRQLVRPTYACRSCESQGHDPQIVRAVLPPEPIPRSGIGSGLLAHVMVSKMIDHLPLHRQETTRGRSRPSPSSAPCTPSNARSGRNGENRGEKFTDADVVRGRQSRAGPILAAVADWLDMQHRTATPKSLFGQAVAYSRNQWGSLVRYLDDARFCIDNGAAERAIRPPAV